MRITSGLHKGRVLNSPKDNLIRPTSDKVRQAVFNSLESRDSIRGAAVLDAFCGTGALGLEALSRGADHCDFYDIHHQSISLCRSNVELLREEERSCLFKKSVLHITKKDVVTPYSLVFLDPPYNKGLVEQILEILFENNLCANECIFVIEVDKKEKITNRHIDIFYQKIYGDTQILLANKVL